MDLTVETAFLAVLLVTWTGLLVRVATEGLNKHSSVNGHRDRQRQTSH